MSQILTIVDEIVTGLNAGTFSEDFTAERKYIVQDKLEDVDELMVTLVPKGQALSMADRSKLSRIVTVDMRILKKLNTKQDSEIDTLMSFVDELIDFFKDNRKYGTAFWFASENKPIYSPEHLSEMRVFMSVMTLSFLVVTV